MWDMSDNPSQDLRSFLGSDRFGCVMADPPWRIGDIARGTVPRVCLHTSDFYEHIAVDKLSILAT